MTTPSVYQLPLFTPDKHCGHCRTIKPLTSFNRNGAGYQSWCKDCLSAYHKVHPRPQRRYTSTERTRDSAFAAEFRALYPGTPNGVLAEKYGVKAGTVARWAGLLGVHKDAAYRSLKQSINASKRRLSAEQRAKLSAIALAQHRTVSAETKARIMATKAANGTLPQRGPAHPNWKGGRPWERFKDPRYLAWRDAVLERDGHVCQECGRRCGKSEKGLAAHHVKSYAHHPALRYEVSNGVTLCRRCHMLLHGKPIAPRMVPCACGCGTMISDKTAYGRPRRYVNGHASRGRPMTEQAKQLLHEQRKGRPLTPEHRAKIGAGVRRAKRSDT